MARFRHTLPRWSLVCLLLLSGVVGLTITPAPATATAAPGNVVAWGNDQQGQLGDGAFTYPRLNPVDASGLTNVVALAGGENHSLALLADGTVRAWGYNDYGQLGDGTTIKRNAPAVVCASGNAESNSCVPLTNVTAIAAAYAHSLALLSDGSIRAWGYDRAGQLGDGVVLGSADGFVLRTNPVTVCASESSGGANCPALGGVTAIAAGAYHSLALLTNGTVKAWGYNGGGQLGTGGGDRSIPAIVCSAAAICPGLTGVVAIAAGVGHSLALHSNGKMSAWGNNLEGELGDGTTTQRANPVPVCASGSGLMCPQLDGVVAIASATGATDGRHSLALMNDGSVRSWGRNALGQLGGGSVGGIRMLPAPVLNAAGTGNLSGVAAISGGAGHSLALMNDGTVRAWGQNNVGELGDGTTTQGPNQPSLPVTVCASGSGAGCPALSGITAIAAGGYHSLALKTPVAPSPSPSASPSPAGATFADVPTNYWAYDQIERFYARSITTGCGDDSQGRRLFCPERGVTRAEMAVFLDRTLGNGTPPAPASQRFTDVPTNYWAYAFIDQFAQLGITTGCGGTEFCPDRGVTRAEMAAFLIRALKKTQLAPATPTFADVPASHPQFGYIEALVQVGITTGCGDDGQGHRFYCPDRGVSRAEMAVFLIRAFP